VRAALILVTVALAMPGATTVRADDRPTSGDLSLRSGRTMGNGEVALAAALGWPGIWAEVTLAPSSTLNVAVRATVAYASPIAGFGSGVGGALAVPIRWHLYGHRDLDVAVLLEPTGIVGEASLVGQTAGFGNDLGVGAGGLAGILLGLQISDVVTFALGAAGEVFWVTVRDDAGPGSDVVATGILILGVEALMARDTMLFVDVRGGYALARERLFDGHEIARLALGVAYLL
jgi:hypothetical protein